MVDPCRQNSRVLVLTEREGTAVGPITFGLINSGRKIASDLRGTLCAALLGCEISGLSKEIAQFADKVYSLEHPLLGDFRPELYTSALEQLCQELGPDVILMGGTHNNLDLAPRLASKLGVEVITDCIDLGIEMETGHLLCTKPIYGAKVISTFKLERKPYMATLRLKAGDPIPSRSEEGEIIDFNPGIDSSLMKVEMIERVKEENVSLDKAAAIVAGGRGIKDVEGLERIKGLIRVLKSYFSRVELGASRPLVDSRLVPSSHQVGLTGAKVAPEIYIAVGISGSMQHLTGILGAKKIIAINIDPKANIFKVADYGVIGSFEEVVPALGRKLEELK